MNDAVILLKRYAQSGDEEAFRQVVAQYFNFVHGIAVRRLNNHSADALDLVQLVFSDLARKAQRIPEDTQLGGWLHQHTCFLASKLIRAELRRAAREELAAHMNTLAHDDPWEAIAPIIDDTLHTLDEPDRLALLLRFFEGRDLRSVGRALNISEDAAQKRVARAIEKLRSHLEARGVAISIAALSSALLANAAPSVPAAPILAISTTAAAAGAKSAALAAKPVLLALAAALLIPCGMLYFRKAPSVTPLLGSGLTPQIVASTSNASIPAPAAPATVTNLPEPPADPNLGIGGFVVNPAGAPIPGATVIASPLFPSGARVTTASPSSRATNVTDAAGSWFASPLPSDADVILRVSHPNFAPLLLRPNSAAMPELKSRSHRIVLSEGAHITGLVTGRDDQPVPGAKVSFGPRYFWARVETVTDQSGRYELKRVPTQETNVITVLADEYAPASRTFRHAWGPLELNFSLDPPSTIRGRVVDPAGVPIAGARVSREEFSRNDGLIWETKTDLEGRFIWSNAPPTPQKFYIAAGRHAQLRDRVLTPGDEEHIITITTAPRIKGSVVDANTGQPLPSFSVAPARGSIGRALGAATSVQSFTNGVFDLQLDEHGYSIVEVRAPGYFAESFQIPSDHEFAIKLQPAPTIRGTVLSPSRKPLPGIQVAALGNQNHRWVSIKRGRVFAEQPNADIVLTDEKGEFSISPTSEASFLVAADPESGFADTPVTNDQQFYQLQLQPWSRIEGTFHSNNSPTPNRYVTIICGVTHIQLSYQDTQATTDAAGRFTFERIPPRPAILSVRSSSTPAVTRPSASTNLVLSPGAVTYVELFEAP